jgi:hypothetical protein
MRAFLGLSAAALAASYSPASAQPSPEPFWSVEGRLEDGDSVERDILSEPVEEPDGAEEGADSGHRYDEHQFHLDAGRRYRISAASDDFDTMIRLYRAGEDEPVAENDDFEGLNSRISYTPAESGDYVLRILSFSPAGRGAYTASAEPLPPLPPPVSGSPASTSRLRWRIWEGELAEGDLERDERYYDDYLVTMEAGQTRLISVEAAGFDPMVWVLRGSEREGEPLDLDDDAGPGVNALLGFQADEAGDYIVRVTSYTSYGDGATGAYRVRISDGLTPPLPLPPAETDEASEH